MAHGGCLQIWEPLSLGTPCGCLVLLSCSAKSRGHQKFINGVRHHHMLTRKADVKLGQLFKGMWGHWKAPMLLEHVPITQALGRLKSNLCLCLC